MHPADDWAADVAAAEPVVHEDMATMRARNEQKLQAERDEAHAAVMARLDREMAQELAAPVEVTATPAPAPEAPTEPAVPARRHNPLRHCTSTIAGSYPVAPAQRHLEQRILAMLAAAAVNGRSVSLATFRRDLRDPVSRDEITGRLNLMVRAKKIVEEGLENGRTYRLPPMQPPARPAPVPNRGDGMEESPLLN